ATGTTTAPFGTAGNNVDFFDVTTNTDLGNGVFQSSSSNTSTWTFITGVKTFNVTAADTIKATYVPATGGSFIGSFSTTTQAITQRALTVTAATNSKVYDSTMTAGALPTITTGSLVTGDTPNFIEAYSNKNVGTSLTLTPSGVVNDGNGGANYSYTFAAASVGTITTRAITVTAVANSKVYDGGATAAATPTFPALQGTDSANFIEVYSSKNVGTNLTLTPSGVVNDGNGGANYSYTFAAASVGTITTRAITVTAAS